MTIGDMETYERNALLRMAKAVGFDSITELLHYCERQGITDSRELFDKIHKQYIQRRQRHEKRV